MSHQVNKSTKSEMRNPKQIRRMKKKISKAHVLFVSEFPVSSFSFVSNCGFRISKLLLQRLPNHHRAIPVDIVRQDTDMSRKRPGKAHHIATSVPREPTCCGEGGAVEKVENDALGRCVKCPLDRRVKRGPVKRIQRAADDDHIRADEQAGRVRDEISIDNGRASMSFVGAIVASSGIASIPI